MTRGFYVYGEGGDGTQYYGEMRREVDARTALSALVTQVPDLEYAYASDDDEADLEVHPADAYARTWVLRDDYVPIVAG